MQCTTASETTIILIHLIGKDISHWAPYYYKKITWAGRPIVLRCRARRSWLKISPTNSFCFISSISVDRCFWPRIKAVYCKYHSDLNKIEEKKFNKAQVHIYIQIKVLSLIAAPSETNATHQGTISQSSVLVQDMHYRLSFSSALQVTIWFHGECRS